MDSAPWIRNQLELHGTVDQIGLDFYHFSEHVHTARGKVFGEEDVEGRDWAERLLHQAKHEGYSSVWKTALAWRSKSSSQAAQEEADRLLHYISERKDMIRYPEFLAAGWQIGSGPIEAQCKTTTARVKGSGKRRDADNAEAMMALACLENSCLWQNYWLNADPSTN